MKHAKTEQTPNEVLRESGLANPTRVARLICETIDFLELDLRGATVLTEAASGPYVVTPIVASAAGAERVIAITRDSPYASAEDVIAQTRALESLISCRRSEIHTQRSLELFAEADIVTNLGFVRPIDNQIVRALKPTAVIPLMCEAWELRANDIDLEKCCERGIEVVGTNEDFPGLDVFAYSGPLCLKLLLDAQIEAHKTRAIVVSTDKFGTVIAHYLRRTGALVTLHERVPPSDQLVSADVLIIADYSRTDEVVGPNGDVTAQELARKAPSITVVQFAGRNDVQSLRENEIAVFPPRALDARRTALTLAALGPKPVVELHAAGLKVAELTLGGGVPQQTPRSGVIGSLLQPAGGSHARGGVRTYPDTCEDD